MPAKSKAQQRLMAAAANGATFAKAQQVRATMAPSTLGEFVQGSMKDKPEHVTKRKGGHPHQNLGKYLHPKKG